MPSNYGLVALVILFFWAALCTYHELRIEKDVLKNSIQPKLKIFYDKGDPRCYMKKPIQNPTGGMGVFNALVLSIGIKNMGHKTIEKVKILLEQIKPEMQTLGTLPIELRCYRDNTKDCSMSRVGFSLDPEAIEYVNVIIQVHEKEYYQKLLIPIISQFWYTNTLKMGNYELTILARGKDIAQQSKRFKLNYDRNDMISFVEVNNG